MTQHYDVYLARGREVVGGPVGTATTRGTGDIALEAGVYPVSPHYHLILRPVPAEGAA
ncbi:MAG: hypothetical protein U0871_04585 [Gemmataceae bacterium]